MGTSRFRIEQDLLGEIKIPREARYGIQTQRAILNFPRTRQSGIGQYPNLIRGLLYIKQAAAIANMRGGFLSKQRQETIDAAAKIVSEEELFDDFPIHRLHGGGGTSANMNVNEVLAFIGNGSRLVGSKSSLHPNDHVNLHQSTNDVYPSACHIAIILEWTSLENAINKLHYSILSKAESLKKVCRLSRTCLRDAVPITFQDFFSGYGALLNRNSKKMNQVISRLYGVNLGGLIVGSTAGIPQEYIREVIPALREVTGVDAYFRCNNLFDAAQNPDEIVDVASSLDLFARGLIKLAKDLRLLSSGPEAGFNEIQIPAVQPGSSAMPGKVNPVIPEFVIQSCMQVIGNCHAARMAMEHGELDLNIWESIVVFNILDSMDLLEHAVLVLRTKCVDDLKADIAVNQKHCDTTIATITKLVQQHGYRYIDELCKKALAENKNIKTMLAEHNLVSK